MRDNKPLTITGEEETRNDWEVYKDFFQRHWFGYPNIFQILNYIGIQQYFKDLRSGLLVYMCYVNNDETLSPLLTYQNYSQVIQAEQTTKDNLYYCKIYWPNLPEDLVNKF